MACRFTLYCTALKDGTHQPVVKELVHVIVEMAGVKVVVVEQVAVFMQVVYKHEVTLNWKDRIRYG